MIIPVCQNTYLGRFLLLNIDLAILGLSIVQIVESTWFVEISEIPQPRHDLLLLRRLNALGHRLPRQLPALFKLRQSPCHRHGEIW